MPPAETLIASYLQVNLDVDALSHAVWENVQPVNLTRHWSGDEAPVISHAEVRIVWSDESLNVRFICNQGQPLVVSTNPRLDQKTIGLWDRDVCEIFLAPFPDQPDCYFEFEAAPTGEWVDLAVCFKDGKRENDFKFISGMTVATRILDKTVVIAMRIPWGERLPRPRRGDEWRANLFRCVGLGNDRYLAWQPTFTPEPNFHVPEAFGKLLFT